MQFPRILIAHLLLGLHVAKGISLDASEDASKEIPVPTLSDRLFTIAGTKTSEVRLQIPCVKLVELELPVRNAILRSISYSSPNSLADLKNETCMGILERACDELGPENVKDLMSVEEGRTFLASSESCMNKLQYWDGIKPAFLSLFPRLRIAPHMNNLHNVPAETLLAVAERQLWYFGDTSEDVWNNLARAFNGAKWAEQPHTLRAWTHEAVKVVMQKNLTEFTAYLTTVLADFNSKVSKKGSIPSEEQIMVAAMLVEEYYAFTLLYQPNRIDDLSRHPAEERQKLVNALSNSELVAFLSHPHSPEVGRWIEKHPTDSIAKMYQDRKASSDLTFWQRTLSFPEEDSDLNPAIKPLIATTKMLVERQRKSWIRKYQFFSLTADTRISDDIFVFTKGHLQKAEASQWLSRALDLHHIPVIVAIVTKGYPPLAADSLFTSRLDLVGLRQAILRADNPAPEALLFALRKLPVSTGTQYKHATEEVDGRICGLQALSPSESELFLKYRDMTNTPSDVSLPESVAVNVRLYRFLRDNLGFLAQRPKESPESAAFGSGTDFSVANTDAIDAGGPRRMWLDAIVAMLARTDDWSLFTYPGKESAGHVIPAANLDPRIMYALGRIYGISMMWSMQVALPIHQDYLRFLTKAEGDKMSDEEIDMLLAGMHSYLSLDAAERSLNAVIEAQKEAATTASAEEAPVDVNNGSEDIFIQALNMGLPLKPQYLSVSQRDRLYGIDSPETPIFAYNGNPQEALEYIARLRAFIRKTALEGRTEFRHGLHEFIHPGMVDEGTAELLLRLLLVEPIEMDKLLELITFDLTCDRLTVLDDDEESDKEVAPEKEVEKNEDLSSSSSVAQRDPSLDKSEAPATSDHASSATKHISMRDAITRFFGASSNLARSNFLAFSTGNGMLPIGLRYEGTKHLTIKCEESKSGKNAPIPTSSTCFYSAIIYQTTTYRQLVEKIKKAIEDGIGFQKS